VASIIYTTWGSLAWLVEEYMEDFLWLYNTIAGTRRLLKEGATEALPSPDPINLVITGANLDEEGRYTIELTCSTKSLGGLFGLLPMSEEDWARQYAQREVGWDGGIIRQYKGVRIRVLFRTAKGDVEDVFLKPPGAVVKRTIVLPAPYSYVEVTTELVFDVDEQKIEETKKQGQVLVVAGIGSLLVPFSEELAPLITKLGGLSPSTIEYWLIVSQIADALKKIGVVGTASALAAYAATQLQKLMPTARAAPTTVTMPAPPTPAPPAPAPAPTTAKTKTSMTAVAYAIDTTLRIETALRDENGIPLSGKTIEFRVEGKTVGSATTDASGTATLDIPKPEAAVRITAEFAGDENYEGCTAATSYVPPMLPLRRPAKYVPI